jgi:predicted component of type VI protein secretion system
MLMEIVEIETRDGLQRIPLDKTRITIGRLPGNDIVLPYTQISRHHAEIRQRGEEWWIIDLGSTNGLRVGGRQVKEHLLTDGDRVILAPTIFLYFNGKRAAAPVTVEGSTVEMPVLADASAPAPPGRATSAASSAMLEPSVTPADDLASIAAMPMPRRRMGMVPPPSANQPPGTSAIAPAPSGHAPRLAPSLGRSPARETPAPPTTPPPVDEQDLWLLADAQGQRNPPTAHQPPSAIPNGNVGNAPPPPTGPELPLSSPFALLRQQHTPTHALPRRPILVSCPMCQASTAPDSPYCWSCHQTIARPCRQCGLFLLPIQARCPRCATANANAVKR